jgi:hypothetical protein
MGVGEQLVFAMDSRSFHGGKAHRPVGQATCIDTGGYGVWVHINHSAMSEDLSVPMRVMLH